MAFDLSTIKTQPGDLVYVREDDRGLCDRIRGLKVRAMEDQTIAVAYGPTSFDAETYATVVVDETGRVIKDRRGENRQS